MKVTISLFNAHKGTIRALPNAGEYHYLTHARDALHDALDQYTDTIPDGIYSALVVFDTGAEKSFLLECRANAMKELFSHY